MNLKTKPRLRLAAVLLTAPLLVLAAGCASFPFPITPPGADGVLGPELNPGGDFVGTGQKVSDEFGEYETIEINQESMVYEFTESSVDPAVYDAGFTEADVREAQTFALNYMVNEYLDSTALDTGVAGYQNWYNSSAGAYYSAEMMADPQIQTGSSGAILNNATQNSIPSIMRDGKPRVSSLTLVVSGIIPGTYNDAPFIDVGLSFEVDYRITDQSAIAFSSLVSGLSESDFMASGLPKDSLKDGTGENKYTSDGWIRVGVGKDGDRTAIVGFQSNANFITDDFINK